MQIVGSRGAMMRFMVENGAVARLYRTAILLVALLGTSTVGAEVVVVLNSGDASISLIDRVTRKEIKRIPTGKEPHHLMQTPDDKSLIVAGAASNDLLFLDPITGDVQRHVKNIPDPYQIAYSPDRTWFVAAALRLNRVDLYKADDLKPVKRIPLASTPSHLIFDRDGKFVFVTMQESRDIAAIDLATQTVAWRLPVGLQPAGIWMTPDDRHLLVGVMGEDFVAVIDWRKRAMVKKIITGKGAHNFQALGDGRHVFVTNRVVNTISLIDQQTLSVVRSFSTPSGPDCMEVSADGKELWVTARWAQKVAVIDIPTGKLIDTIPVGRSPHGIYFRNHAPRR